MHVVAKLAEYGYMKNHIISVQVTLWHGSSYASCGGDYEHTGELYNNFPVYRNKRTDMKIWVHKWNTGNIHWKISDKVGVGGNFCSGWFPVAGANTCPNAACAAGRASGIGVCVHVSCNLHK